MQVTINSIVIYLVTRSRRIRRWKGNVGKIVKARNDTYREENHGWTSVEPPPSPGRLAGFDVISQPAGPEAQGHFTSTKAPRHAVSLSPSPSMYKGHESREVVKDEDEGSLSEVDDGPPPELDDDDEGVPVELQHQHQHRQSRSKADDLEEQLAIRRPSVDSSAYSYSLTSYSSTPGSSSSRQQSTTTPSRSPHRYTFPIPSTSSSSQAAHTAFPPPNPHPNARSPFSPASSSFPPLQPPLTPYTPSVPDSKDTHSQPPHSHSHPRLLSFSEILADTSMPSAPASVYSYHWDEPPLSRRASLTAPPPMRREPP